MLFAIASGEVEGDSSAYVWQRSEQVDECRVRVLC